MKKRSILILIFIAAILLKVLSTLIIYNKLIDEEHFLHIAHGRLETELQRRMDTITRVNEAVNNYVDIEKRIFHKLIELNGLIESDSGIYLQRNIQNEIMSLLTRMSVIVEAYPDIKSKGPYVYLMEIIQHAGRRVTAERMYYNERVYEYNMICHILPYKFYASMYGFHKEDFFKSDLGAEIAPIIES